MLALAILMCVIFIVVVANKYTRMCCQGISVTFRIRLIADVMQLTSPRTILLLPVYNARTINPEYHSHPSYYIYLY